MKKIWKKDYINIFSNSLIIKIQLKQTFINAIHYTQSERLEDTLNICCN